MKYNNFKISQLHNYRHKERVKEWLAWYSADPEIISNYYAWYLNNHTYNGRFYSNLDQEERQNVVHLPVANDIARVSSNMLFSEAPEFKYESDRLDIILNDVLFYETLLNASEICSATGGVFLKIDTSEYYDYPIITIKTPDVSNAKFSGNKLISYDCYRTVKIEKDKHYRLFELRYLKDGYTVIDYQLYKGTSLDIGTAIPLSTFSETENLEPQVLSELSGIGVVYIPNVLPNSFDIHSKEGVSDFAKCISLMDSLDEAWTSWIRDLEIGQGRIFADEDIFKDITTPHNRGNTVTYDKEKRFDAFQRVYQKISLDAWKHEGTKPIEVVQFKIRVDEHQKTCKSLFEQIITNSGYSPQTFGITEGGRAESGTALRIRERKSFLTRQGKARYWQNGINKLVHELQEFDSALGFVGVYEPNEFNCVLSDSVIHDDKEISETIKNLKMANSISTYQSLKMLHVDWSEDDIMHEMKRIFEEQNGEYIPEPL